MCATNATTKRTPGSCTNTTPNRSRCSIDAAEVQHTSRGMSGVATQTVPYPRLLSTGIFRKEKRNIMQSLKLCDARMKPSSVRGTRVREGARTHSRSHHAAHAIIYRVCCTPRAMHTQYRALLTCCARFVGSVRTELTLSRWCSQAALLVTPIPARIPTLPQDQNQFPPCS